MPERKVAVVTGTSSGIGLHTAVALAERGIRVVATMRDTGKSSQLTAEADQHGVDVAVRELDVTDRATRLRVLDEVAAEFGTIGVLVNNAGLSVAGSLEQLDDAALQAQLEVNFLGAAALTRHVLAPMRRAGFGEPQSARDAAAVLARAATTDTPRFRWQTSEAAAMSAGLSLRDLDGSGVVTAMSVLLQ